MLIRYRWWDTDGVSAHKAIRGATEYVFLDSEHGLCDVRDRVGIEYLLARSANYELAYDRYGVTFDAQGREVELQTSGDAGDTVTMQEPPFKRKPGRPRKE